MGPPSPSAGGRSLPSLTSPLGSTDVTGEGHIACSYLHYEQSCLAVISRSTPCGARASPRLMLAPSLRRCPHVCDGPGLCPGQPAAPSRDGSGEMAAADAARLHSGHGGLRGAQLVRQPHPLRPSQGGEEARSPPVGLPSFLVHAQGVPSVDCAVWQLLLKCPPHLPPELQMTPPGLLPVLSPIQVDEAIAKAFSSEFTKRLHVLGRENSLCKAPSPLQ